MMENTFRNNLALVFSGLACCSLSAPVFGQDDVSGADGEQVIQSVTTNARIYTMDDFTRFTPRNALDMLERVPGFSVNSGNQGRGLGSANTNVLINSQRLSSKSQDVFDQLRRITAENVERIEIVDGATLDMPGLSGQVANVITRNSGISGSYEYRTIHRPKYAQASWFGGVCRPVVRSGTGNGMLPIPMAQDEVAPVGLASSPMARATLPKCVISICILKESFPGSPAA